MIFDSLTLASVADELGRTISGGKIEKITQPTEWEIVLRVYHAGTVHYLLLSADPEFARVHRSLIRRENPPQPPAFCMLLRKYLDGAWIDAVSMPLGFGERVLHIDLRAVDGARYALVAEIMGKHSNVILVNAAHTILGAIKPITRQMSRFRQILPGLPYAAPPRQRATGEGGHKRDPFGPFDPESVPAPAPGEEADWLLQTFAGVSPFLAQEIVLRAKPPLTSQSLWYALSEVLTHVRVGDYAPRVWSDARGTTQGAYPIALRAVPAHLQYARDSISVALDQAASSISRVETLARARLSLQAALHRTRKARERERDELDRALRNADRAGEYQQSGDLLLSHQHLIQKGQQLVSVPDYYVPPQPDGEPTMRFIALDPSQSVQENAERFFKRSRKARTSMNTLQVRRIEIDEELALLTQAELDSASAATEQQITAIREAVSALLAYNARHSDGRAEGPGHKEGPAFEGHKIKTYRSVDGWEILVGENATANDYLTTRVASPSDIWLHVRAATSAHGIIRAQNRPAAVSAAALQQAAGLVAARSEVKHSSLVPVDYTLKKYVRKPRKSAPGSVTYQNEKTLHVPGIHD